MKLQLKNKFRYSLCVVLACFFISCSSQDENIKMLSDKPHLMTDKNGTVWIIEHHIGDTYTVTFLYDSLNTQ